MNALVSILSQLFWGVTVGALTAAATALCKLALLGCGVFGAGRMVWGWRAMRTRTPDDPD